MPNGSPRYQIDGTWRIFRALHAFFRALHVPVNAKGRRTWSNTAPTTVWNFDHDQPARPQLMFFREEQKTKNSF